MRIAIAIYCGIVALFLVGVTLRAEGDPGLKAGWEELLAELRVSGETTRSVLQRTLNKWP